MVRYRRLFLSLAGALISALLVSAAWASADGTRAPPTPAATPAAADAAGPLVWRPLGFGAAAEKAHDLCDDDAAIEAGLDGGALEEDRANLGIDCADRASPRRYGYLTTSGALALGSTPGDAKAFAKGIHGDGDEAVDQEPPGRALGFFGRTAPAPAAADAVQLVPGSLSVRDGVVRGLVQNTSTGKFARNVAVSVSGAAWNVPLSLQPGETAPFEIEGWAGPAAPEVGIEAALSADADLDRALLLTGAPGHWYGDAAAFPGMPGTVADLPEGEFHYFESFVEVAAPTSHPSLAAPVRERVIENLAAHVAFFDDAGAVIDVAPLQVRRSDGTAGTSAADRAAFGDSLVVGFVVPVEAADFAVWIGGAK